MPTYGSIRIKQKTEKLKFVRKLLDINCKGNAEQQPSLDLTKTTNCENGDESC